MMREGNKSRHDNYQYNKEPKPQVYRMSDYSKEHALHSHQNNNYKDSIHWIGMPLVSFRSVSFHLLDDSISKISVTGDTSNSAAALGITVFPNLDEVPTTTLQPLVLTIVSMALATVSDKRWDNGT
jgi:hypothetical protein